MKELRVWLYYYYYYYYYMKKKTVLQVNSILKYNFVNSHAMTGERMI